MTRARPSPFVLLVIVLVTVSVFPAPVLARSTSDHGVLFDTDRQQIATATVNGTQYQVSRYDNVLPYADGIEVSTNGQRVTSEATQQTVLSIVATKQVLATTNISEPNATAALVTSRSAARRTFRLLAWQEATEQLTSKEIRALKNVSRQSKRVEPIVTPPATALTRVIKLINKTKNTSVAGASAWDAATKAAPELVGFDVTVHKLRSGIRPWKNTTQTINANLPAAIDAYEAEQRGESVNDTEMARRFAVSITALMRLRDRTDVLPEGRLADAATTSAQIATGASGVPVVGGEIESGFGALNTTLSTSAKAMGHYEDRLYARHTGLREISATADRRQSQLQDRWQSDRNELLKSANRRESARTKVYATIVGIGLCLFLLLGFGYRINRSR